MKNKILIFLVLIFILSLTLCFFSCTDTKEPTPTDPPAEEKRLILYDGVKTNFSIVIPSDKDRYYSMTASAVYNRLSDLTNARFSIKNEAGGDSLSYEILIGPTQRNASQDILNKIPRYGYVIKVTERKLVIVGSSAVYTNEALYYFFDVMMNDPQYVSNGVISLPVGLEIIKSFETPITVDPAKALAQNASVYAYIDTIFSFTGKDGFEVSQGAATDGKYIYTVMKKETGGIESGKIFKIDMESLKIVGESDELSTDHSNDMTYDPISNQLVITNMKDNLLTLVDAETLTVSETKQLNYGTYGISYIEKLERFALLGYGDVAGLIIADRNFSPIKASTMESTPGFIGQGMDADERYAYVPLSPPSNVSYNVIQIYSLDGEYFGDIKLFSEWESETIFHYKNDFYIQFYQNGSVICKLEFYIKFE